jgi:hypothetical protein
VHGIALHYFLTLHANLQLYKEINYKTSKNKFKNEESNHKNMGLELRAFFREKFSGEFNVQLD